jgi:hypothetical protein
MFPVRGGGILVNVIWKKKRKTGSKREKEKGKGKEKSAKNKGGKV